MSDAQDPRHASAGRRATIQDLAGPVSAPAQAPQAEAVNHPSYYGGEDNVYEVIKVLHAWGLEKDALLWNTVKYIARHGKKPGEDPLQALKKARVYLDRRIQAIEEGRK